MLGLIIGIVVCYLIGSLSSESLGNKLLELSARQKNSEGGNSRLYKLLRCSGGASVIMIDVLKGFAAVWLARISLLPDFLLPMVTALYAVSAAAGCCYPVFSKFKSENKAVAVVLGILLASAPQAAFLCALLWLAVLLLTRWVSAASLSLAAAAPFMVYGFGYGLWPALLAAVLGAAVAFRYRESIGRLLSGKEEHISLNILK
ncbi:glycerol-3-phosphate acyltransferase [bacterium]|nr:glycerol-3-phosphate acyltransferase [bacterium]